MKPVFSTYTDDCYQINHLLGRKKDLLKGKVKFPSSFFTKTGSFKTVVGRDTSRGVKEPGSVNVVDRFPVQLDKGTKGSGKEIGCLEERNNIKTHVPLLTC